MRYSRAKFWGRFCKTFGLGKKKRLSSNRVNDIDGPTQFRGRWKSRSKGVNWKTKSLQKSFEHRITNFGWGSYGFPIINFIFSKLDRIDWDTNISYHVMLSESVVIIYAQHNCFASKFLIGHLKWNVYSAVPNKRNGRKTGYPWTQINSITDRLDEVN